MLTRFQQLLFAPFVLVLGLVPLVAQPTSRAQEIERARQDKAENLEPETPGSVERAFIKFQGLEFVQRFGQPSNGFFPKLGGLASGQGTGLGLQYARTDIAGGLIKFSGFGVASFSGSQRYGLDVTAPYIANRRVSWNLAASRRTLTKVGFYGLGPDSHRDDRTSFLLEDTSLDTSLTFQPVGKR